MKYDDLRGFMARLEERELLTRIDYPVSPYLEMTVVSDKVLRANGPALLFTHPKNHHMPVLTNLFGTVERVAYAMGQENIQALREVGQLLAALKEPTPPKSFKDAFNQLPLLKQAFNMAPKMTQQALCQTHVIEGPG